MTIQHPRKIMATITGMIETELSTRNDGPERLAAKIYSAVVNPSLAESLEERTILGGHLSRHSQFRLVVTGSVGQNEIDHLISQLNLLRAILGEDEQHGSPE